MKDTQTQIEFRIRAYGGTVEEVQLSDSGAASYAVLEPAADFDSLVEVFVIKSFDIQT